MWDPALGSYEDMFPRSKGYLEERYFTHEKFLTQVQVEELRRLIQQRSQETAIDQHIKANPAILAAVMKFNMTGHHGLWVLSQQAIRHRMPSGSSGLIPDYLIAAERSDGMSYLILDLKGADAKPFKRPQGHDYLVLSDELNRGICQVLMYIDYAASIQQQFRDPCGFGMRDFREPRGMILIGTEDTSETALEPNRLRAAWNRNFENRIAIRTYSAVLRHCEAILAFQAGTSTP